MADIQPETVYVSAPSPGVEATSDAPISNNLTPPPDAASGGGLALTPSPGTPGSITPSNPQPARPPKESFVSGLRRGAGGEQYVVDGQGNLQSARTTAPSGKGEFGSILGGIVMGALAGASRARMSGAPSADVSGGAGAGAAAAVEAAQQRDLRNRGQAQQNFTNQQQVQKMSREQLESAAVIGHLAAQTASEVDANKRANDEHPLVMKNKELGMQESAVNIQKGYQDLANGSLSMMQTLTDAGISPTAMPTSWTDAQAHIKDNASSVRGCANGTARGMFTLAVLSTAPLSESEALALLPMRYPHRGLVSEHLPQAKQICAVPPLAENPFRVCVLVLHVLQRGVVTKPKPGKRPIKSFKTAELRPGDDDCATFP
jgi:hypothetical protein